MIRFYGGNCKWWHFYPHETVEDMRKRFEEIRDGKSDDGIVNNIAQGFGKLKNQRNIT